MNLPKPQLLLEDTSPGGLPPSRCCTARGCACFKPGSQRRSPGPEIKPLFLADLDARQADQRTCPRHENVEKDEHDSLISPEAWVWIRAAIFRWLAQGFGRDVTPPGRVRHSGKHGFTHLEAEPGAAALGWGSCASLFPLLARHGFREALVSKNSPPAYGCRANLRLPNALLTSPRGNFNTEPLLNADEAWLLLVMQPCNSDCKIGLLLTERSRCAGQSLQDLGANNFSYRQNRCM